MRKNKASFAALGGVLCALGIAVMFFGSLVPLATYVIPAVSSLAVLYMSVEFSRGAGLLAWVCISLLSILLVPDKEIALLFTCFFGYYPVLKGVFEQKLGRTACWICKFLVFAVSIGGMYFVITRLLVLPTVRDEFAQYTPVLLLALGLLGLIMFLMFDISLTKIIVYYVRKLRPKLAKH